MRLTSVLTSRYRCPLVHRQYYRSTVPDLYASLVPLLCAERIYTHANRLIPADTHDGNPEIRIFEDTFPHLELQQWLNDDCMNGITALLTYGLTDPKCKIKHYQNFCSIFHSYAFSYFRDGNRNATTLHSMSKHGKYWKRPLWIIPIHRVNHWVLAIVSHLDKKIFMYDSFGHAFRAAWEADVLVTTMLTVCGVATVHDPSIHRYSETSLCGWIRLPENGDQGQLYPKECTMLCL